MVPRNRVDEVVIHIYVQTLIVNMVNMKDIIYQLDFKGSYFRRVVIGLKIDVHFKYSQLEGKDEFKKTIKH